MPAPDMAGVATVRPTATKGFWLGALDVGSDGSRTRRQEGLFAQCKGHNVVLPGKVRS